ncbi:hypothetical protein CPC08DRAFT_368623 [Agrocybe pediades]|nr:hypothetical protein CPC08DRAFT_368623 [Agrocybe pediades]
MTVQTVQTVVTETEPKHQEIIDLTGLSDSSDVEDLNTESDDENEDDELSDDGSEVSEVEIVLNTETRTQLRKAIETLSETRLREMLQELVETDVNIEAALTRELVTLNRDTQEIVQRWEKCLNCSYDFDTNTYREEDECAFHPGDVEVLDDKFLDWDESCHGPMDTSSNRREFPENFAWSCCDKTLNSPGCVRDRHIPVAPTRKRRRIDE